MRHHRVMGSPAWTSKLVTSCVKLSIPQNGSSTMVNLWMRLQASQWMHMRWDPYKIAKKPHQESQDGKTRASKPIKVFMKMGWNRRVRFKLGLEVVKKRSASYLKLIAGTSSWSAYRPPTSVASLATDDWSCGPKQIDPASFLVMHDSLNVSLHLQYLLSLLLYSFHFSNLFTSLLFTSLLSSLLESLHFFTLYFSTFLISLLSSLLYSLDFSALFTSVLFGFLYCLLLHGSPLLHTFYISEVLRLDFLVSLYVLIDV